MYITPINPRRYLSAPATMLILLISLQNTAPRQVLPFHCAARLKDDDLRSDDRFNVVDNMLHWHRV